MQANRFVVRDGRGELSLILTDEIHEPTQLYGVGDENGLTPPSARRRRRATPSSSTQHRIKEADLQQLLLHAQDTRITLYVVAAMRWSSAKAAGRSAVAVHCHGFPHALALALTSLSPTAHDQPVTMKNAR